MSAEALRAELEPVFVKSGSVLLAYLFGSAARGETHDRSDIDLAVLFQDSSPAAYRALWKNLHAVLAPRAFDLVSLDAADPVLSFEVIREGVPLFYRSVDTLNSFELRAWHRYGDTRQLRAIGNHYLMERAREWSTRRNPSASGSSSSKR